MQRGAGGWGPGGGEYGGPPPRHGGGPPDFHHGRDRSGPPPPHAAGLGLLLPPMERSGSGPPDGFGGGGRPPKRQQLSHQGNDYCQHFVDTGMRPQNFVRDALEERFEGDSEEGKRRRLIELKDQQVLRHITPSYTIRADLRKLALNKEFFGTRFDVILVDPPWEEYARRAPGLAEDPECWGWREVVDLDVGAVADTPSFVFLWCGSGESLDAGRHCLQKWGFRREEVICWVKTNKDAGKRRYLAPAHQEEGSVLVHTVEHCLVGIRGSLKRELDGHILHTNCDVDVILSEEPPLGSTEKPAELYSIIERFSMGRRRLELFGEDRNARPGWVTVGKRISQTTFKKQLYLSHFKNEDGVPYDEHRGRPAPGAPVFVPSLPEIDELRPGSPVRGQGGGPGGGGGGRRR